MSIPPAVKEPSTKLGDWPVSRRRTEQAFDKHVTWHHGMAVEMAVTHSHWPMQGENTGKMMIHIDKTWETNGFRDTHLLDSDSVNTGISLKTADLM